MASKDTQIINFEEIFMKVCKIPYCKVNREEFLIKQLKGKVTSEQLEDALENGTVNAKIPIELLNSIADGAIKLERTRAAAISTVAGMPGKLAMIATIPADLLQFYAHVVRVAQKLAYIYGYKEIDLDDSTQNVLIIFLGAMSGVNAATAALAKFATENATKIGARVAAKPLSKYALFKIVKTVLATAGIKVTKAGAGQAVSKAVPIIGGVVSGGLTLAIFTPMAKKLKKELAALAAMSPEGLEKANIKADPILTEFEIVNDIED